MLLWARAICSISVAHHIPHLEYLCIGSVSGGQAFKPSFSKWPSIVPWAVSESELFIYLNRCVLV